MLNARIATAVAALTLAVAGCGGDDDETASTPPAPTENKPTVAEKPSTEKKKQTTKKGGGASDTGTAPVGSADVALTEFKVTLAKRTLPREGVYTLRVVNNGNTTHALEAEGPNGESETEEIAPGGSANLKAYFVTGTYKLYCPIGNHEQRGMSTQLRVRS